jgi:hypothetical protein
MEMSGQLQTSSYMRKSPWYTLNKGLGGEGINLFTLTTMELLFLGHSACGFVTIPAMLSWLSPINKTKFNSMSEVATHASQQHFKCMAVRD